MPNDKSRSGELPVQLFLEGTRELMVLSMEWWEQRSGTKCDLKK